MKRHLLLLTAASMCVAVSAQTNDDDCNDVCVVESGGTMGEAGYTVVSPIGRQTVGPIAQAPRLSTLTVPTMQKGQTAFLITGDASRNKLQTMPGGGASTVRIELPKNWSRLIGENK